MAQTVEVTLANFEEIVLEGSKNRAVVVDFWASWSAPCKALSPVLEKLSAELDFVLARVNTETPENQQLAAYFRVSSIPDVRVIHNGQMADVIQGALPEDQLRKRLSRFFLSEEDQMILAAESALEQGMVTAAQELLEPLRTAQPENRKVAYLWARVLVGQGNLEEAKTVLALFQDGDDHYRAARSLLELMDFHVEAGKTDPVAGDAAAYREGCQQAIQGDYRAALETFLEQVTQHPAEVELPARKAMLTLFGVMGPKHALTWEFRSRLNTIVFV